MIDGIPIPLAGGGLGAILLIVFFPYLQMARGKLVSRAELEAEERDHERQMQLAAHDRDEWRAESRLRDQHIVELTEQNTMLLREIAPTLNSFLASLRQAANEVKAGDET